MSLVLNKMLSDEISEFKNYVVENKGIVKSNNISYDYGIYETTIDNKDMSLNAKGEMPNFNISMFKAKNFDGMIELLRLSMENDLFYGLIFIDNDNKPHNLLSYDVISKLNKFKTLTNIKVAVYLSTTKPIKKHTKTAEEAIMTLEVKNISLSVDESKDPELYLMAPEEMREIVDHIDEYHIKVDDNVKLITIAEEMLFNCKMQDGSSLTTINNWSIELSMIDSSIIIPTYGWFSKKDGNVLPLLSNVMHPNVSSSGSSVCTGSHIKNSIIGISELSYGNLNSPMNSTIWDSKMSLSIARGYVNIYHKLLLASIK